MPFAERGEREPVAVPGPPNEDGVREPLIDERPLGPQLGDYSTAAAGRRLHALTVEGVLLRPEVVLPALRGAFGREYHYAVETATTQRLLPADAAHGAVALAEHQTEGRGRLGRTWVDSALMFSVALKPPPPVADWPQLTIVAARAVAGSIGPEATIKHPNDVLVGGRKVAGILAEAGERVVLGVGINVGSAAWPGAGFVEGDRLELLVGVLERLERGYGDWLAGRTLSSA
jgi:Biotin/lipoate A/B protein ligase family